MKFLDKIAQHVHAEHDDLSKLIIILPSERARKYLMAALYKVVKRPFFAPEIITMDRWVRQNTEKAVTDKTRALIQLYSIQKEDKEPKTFDEFMHWGTTILSDFDEIDRYLVDPKQLFRNLKSIKELESFGAEELTESQERFMEFWDRLDGYYEKLNATLEEQNAIYAGRAFRSFAEDLENNLALHDKKILFAGFNALSSAELLLIKKLVKSNKGEVFIDSDVYYFENRGHEAGHFHRHLKEQLQGMRLNFIEERLGNQPLKINMIECVQKTGQIKVASTLLSESTQEQLNETLLLLADETLITAVVQNLPKSIERANITLGLPIRNTSIRTWVEMIFSIQENKSRFKTKAIYFQDLIQFWNHPLIIGILSEEEKKLLLEEEQRIIRQNRIFINPENIQLAGKAKDILLKITANWSDDWTGVIQMFRQLNSTIFSTLDRSFALEKASLECFDNALIDLENIAGEGLPEMSMRTFKQLFNQHWGNKSIAYHGNPMEGLQIMGLLETRALDFKRIICIGMNEGNLPPTNPVQTFIPMDLRRAFGLPTPREKQGLFAHHFYRLLHHCEEFYVTYCSADESFGSNEKSRYLMQLEMELSRGRDQIEIIKELYTIKDEPTNIQRAIEKSPEVIRRMDDLFAKSTSASMLKTYLNCPLDFYFRYVMDFGEADSVEEEIEHNTFGTFIHDTLEELYTPYARINKEGNVRKVPPIRSTDVEKMIKEYPVVLERQFLEHFNNDKQAFTKGKNLLSYQMAGELIKRFLKAEVEFLSIQKEDVFIEMLEQKFESELELTVNGENKKVNLLGKMDRIDRIGDKIRIIDYKSGKVQSKDVEFRKMDTSDELIVESLGKNKHLLQLIQYAYLYYMQFKVIPESSIISFISGNNTPFTLDTKSMLTEEVVQNYPNYLSSILEEVYNEAIPFEHNASQYISYCNYCE